MTPVGAKHPGRHLSLLTSNLLPGCFALCVVHGRSIPVIYPPFQPKIIRRNYTEGEAFR
ncbi:hypothetical protein [Planktothricoides raciborskii]|uniref:Uncharacterized protein n=1 Tax=Planktothricoides raciborskii FACHB-1370 TaxID=2949576 RepID=A0ABR8E8W3_9CYAN|nr:hypothetical protein [Planktothricoides raciborskii]MBD2543279.1 hypothetical protein [Planktothricoides raciborskii FACHB-1370]